MISELCNSLFLTYLFSEYLVAKDSNDSRMTISGSRNTATTAATAAAAAATSSLKQRLTYLMTGVVLAVNVFDRVVGLTAHFHAGLDLLHVFSWPFKILLAASCYVGALYVDINRKSFLLLFGGSPRKQKTSSSNSESNTTSNASPSRMPFFRTFLPKVGWAFLKVLPAYPFLAVLISFGFLFVINLWDFLHLPEEWLNLPIYYGTLYGPFAYTYIYVKQQVVCREASTLPT